jgi:hypothetical protein
MFERLISLGIGRPSEPCGRTVCDPPVGSEVCLLRIGPIHLYCGPSGPWGLLGICFIAEGPIRINAFGRLTQSRSYQSESFGVHFQMHRLKDEMTNWPVIACIMIVNFCKGHECNFSQAASCAYK